MVENLVERKFNKLNTTYSTIQHRLYRNKPLEGNV